jgi:hypothetical protein
MNYPSETPRSSSPEPQSLSSEPQSQDDGCSDNSFLSFETNSSFYRETLEYDSEYNSADENFYTTEEDLDDDEASMNSWVDDEDAVTDPDMHEPWDWETKDLPELNDAEREEYEFMVSRGVAPIRDEMDNVYRCTGCLWELECDYCDRCDRWYDSISVSEYEHRSDTSFSASCDIEAGYSDEVDKVPTKADLGMNSPKGVDATGETPLSLRGATSPHTLIEENGKNSKKSTNKKFDNASENDSDRDSDEESNGSVEVSVEPWLRSLSGRLESLNDSMLSMIKPAAQFSKKEKKDLDQKFSSALEEDLRVIRQLRLERCDHTLFQKRAQRERRESDAMFKCLQHELASEKDGLDGEKKRRLSAEMKSFKLAIELAGYKNQMKEEMEKLRAEAEEWKKRATGEWVSDVAKHTVPDRSAAVKSVPDRSVLDKSVPEKSVPESSVPDKS